MAPHDTFTGSEIAVIGMAARLPGAETLDEFWRNLRDGVESVRRFSEAELLAAGESAALLADPDYVPARPVLSEVEQFDAGFFGMSPQDAAIMDPQHRIFLEVGWEAIEHAAYDPSRFPGSIGVFATCGMNTYMMYHLIPNRRIMETVGEWLVRHTGNDMNFLATRLSYQLGLKGPSMNVQTACSSALVAIHLASQSLLNAECDMALAGGSVIALPQDRGYLHKRGEILSPDGHCRTFDARAEGTLFGSGAGVVVLRRLEDALADGDQVLAVLRGSAVNNDGAMRVGYLAPGVEGQSRVITEALAVSGVAADTISYVEAHGTATLVGDPIEITALTEAYRRQTDQRGYCAIGSLKSNIGHLGEAAGVAGFIKTVLSLQHRQLPPSLHYEQPNPRIDFASSPFVVNATLKDWTSAGVPRRAGITALGAGGTNCHAILEEAPVLEPSAPPARAVDILVLSAKTATALDAVAARLAARLDGDPALALADVAYTLQVGRQVLGHRRALVCRGREDAIHRLRTGSHVVTTAPQAKADAVVFLFPGGGAQYPAMGAGLYCTEPVFQRAVDRCLTLLSTRFGVNLRPLLFPAASNHDEAALQLERSTNSILSVFTIEYALAQLWLAWGVTPAAMTGHSVGEYVAACLAGVMSLDDALAIVHARGTIFERLSPGAMLSVPLSEADLRPFLPGALSLAAVNAPALTVVSGPCDDIAAFERELTSRGLEVRRLPIAVAAHSTMLEPFLAEFRRHVNGVRLSPPSIPFISNLTGEWIRSEDATDPDYWVRHLRHTVRFSDGLTQLLQRSGQVLLEVGPGRTLGSLARLQPVQPATVIASLRHRNEEVPDDEFLLGAAARLWAHGAGPDWPAFHAGTRRRRVALPTYPFERRRHWIAAEAATVVTLASAPVDEAPHRQADPATWFFRPTWLNVEAPVVSDRIDGDVLIFDDGSGLGVAVASELSRRDGDTAGDGSRAGRPAFPTLGEKQGARLTPVERRAPGPGEVESAPPQAIWLVEAGARFAQLAENRFAINPAAGDDYKALFDALGPAAARVNRVLHLWNVDATGDQARPTDAQLERSFFSPLRIAQTIGRLELTQRLDITWVSSGAQRVAGEPAVGAVKATLRGPSLVMPRELPNVACRHVDLEPLGGSWQRARLVRQLVRELASPVDDDTVAFRGADRWVQRYVRHPMPAASSLPPRGAQLITGGLGALGLAIAEHLVNAGARDIVLLSRTALPPRHEWDAWLAHHDQHDAVADRLRKVLACEALGARVLIVAGDVADPVDVQRLVDAVRGAFGRIGGVFHAAGVLADGLMQLKADDSALSVLKPKVHGTLALHAALAADPPDQMVLFSSISAVLGLEGQADYVAANAFLDAFAHLHASGPTRVVSANWCAWRDVGLAASASQARQRGGPAGSPGAAHPWLERRRKDDAATTFTTSFARARQWVIGEHVTRGGEALMPGTGLLELASAAVASLDNAPALELSQVYFHEPFAVAADQSRDLDVMVRPSPQGWEWRIASADTTHASGHAVTADVRPLPPVDLAAIRDRCPRVVRFDDHRLDQAFMAFGPRWANVIDCRYGDDEALLSLALPAEFSDDLPALRLHPALLDMATGGAQQLIAGFAAATDFYVPFSYGRVRVFDALPAALVSHIRLGAGTGHGLAMFDVSLLDHGGRVLVEIADFCMKRVAAAQMLAADASRSQRTASDGARPLDSPAALAEEMLRLGITTAEGLAALDCLLGGDALPQVAVSSVDVAIWQAVLARQHRAAQAEAKASAGSAKIPAVLVDAKEGQDIETRLAAIWSDILGVTQVGPDENFFELGGHSLLAVRLLTRVERTFGRSLSVPALFAKPTIGAIAALLRADRPKAVAQEPTLQPISRDRLRLSRKQVPT